MTVTGSFPEATLPSAGRPHGRILLHPGDRVFWERRNPPPPPRNPSTLRWVRKTCGATFSHPFRELRRGPGVAPAPRPPAQPRGGDPVATRRPLRVTPTLRTRGQQRRSEGGGEGWACRGVKSQEGGRGCDIYTVNTETPHLCAFVCHPACETAARVGDGQAPRLPFRGRLVGRGRGLCRWVKGERGGVGKLAGDGGLGSAAASRHPSGCGQLLLPQQLRVVLGSPIALCQQPWGEGWGNGLLGTRLNFSSAPCFF